MKRWLILAAGLGLVLAIAIIAYQGFGAVAQAFAAVGFGLVAVVVLRAAELSGAGLGWWIVFPPAARCPLHACVLVRFIREAINALLPVAAAGDFAVGLADLVAHAREPAVVFVRLRGCGIDRDHEA
jgi:hypothetical protein